MTPLVAWASVTGTSHTRAGTENQDYAQVKIFVPTEAATQSDRHPVAHRFQDGVTSVQGEPSGRPTRRREPRPSGFGRVVGATQTLYAFLRSVGTRLTTSPTRKGAAASRKPVAAIARPVAPPAPAAPSPAGSASWAAAPSSAAPPADPPRAARRVTAPPLLAVFVGDGAGSASRGGTGAMLAVEAAIDVVRRAAADGNVVPSQQLARACFLAARSAVYREARVAGVSVRSYATTLIGVVVGRGATLVLQIGDGAAVVDFGDGFTLPISPMNGEYANETHFLTERDIGAAAAIRVYDRPAKACAVFSDGLQRLAIVESLKQPHAPLFERLFATLRRAGPHRRDETNRALAEWLSGPSVTARTDDDCTLVLAIPDASGGTVE